MLKTSGSKLSKLKYDELLSEFAFSFNLRRYTMGVCTRVTVPPRNFGMGAPTARVGRLPRAASLAMPAASPPCPRWCTHTLHQELGMPTPSSPPSCAVAHTVAAASPPGTHLGRTLVTLLRPAALPGTTPQLRHGCASSHSRSGAARGVGWKPGVSLYMWKRLSVGRTNAKH
jgi:hypothetical protein